MKHPAIPGGDAQARADYPTVNRLFTFACFSTAPALGSAVSFIWHGGALWCLFAIATGRHRLSGDRHMRLFAGLLYLYVAASILSFLANGPAWEEVYKLLPLVTFLLFPFSYSIWAIAEKEAVSRSAAFAGMGGSYAALVLALAQYFIFDVRPEGGAGNALVFASVTCMAGTVSLAGALILKTRWQMALAGGYLASVLAVILSGSRSVWLVMAIVSLAILAICHKQLGALIRGNLLKTVMAVALIAALSSGILISRVENLATSWAELTESGDYDSSLGLRLALWRMGTERFLERPLLGSGLQNTRDFIRQNLAEDYDVSARFSHFHNGFLTLLVESGLIGAGAILGVFLVAGWITLRTLRMREDEDARFGAMILLVFFLNYIVGGSFNLVLGQDIVDTMFMIFLITGSLLACGTMTADRPPKG